MLTIQAAKPHLFFGIARRSGRSTVPLLDVWCAAMQHHIVKHDPAHAHVSAAHPRMAEMIAQSRRYDVTPALSVRPFDALAESIAYQQLSGKAAATIWGRVRALFPGRKYLDPEAVLDMPDEKLRAAGLSRSKVAALKDLAVKTIEGIVPKSGRALAKMSDEEIIERLTAVRGIGRWTVEMLLLFDLGRLDVWPVNDYGVRKGLAKILGKRKLPTPKQMLKLGKKFAPYRSLAAWYSWRALDAPERVTRK
jgi:DNA-3-methyladenine glycosylase II